MAASPAHTGQITDLTEVYDIRFDTYWALKADVVRECHFEDPTLSNMEVEKEWYADIESRRTLSSILSWLSRTFKLFFINKSKLSGHRLIEREYTDAELASAKANMKTLLRRMMVEFSRFDDQISPLDEDFIESVGVMEDWITEDIAGVFGNLAVKYLKLKIDAQYSKWRE